MGKRGDYSDYYCTLLFKKLVSDLFYAGCALEESEPILIIISILMYLFSFICTVLQIQLSSLLPQKPVYIGATDFYMGICNVKSD